MLKRGSQSTLGYALQQHLYLNSRFWQIALGLFSLSRTNLPPLSFNFVETSTFPGLLDFYFFINLFFPPLLSALVVVQQSLFKSCV